MKHFTRSKEEIFERYKFDQKYKDLFAKLRPEVDESISDELLGILISQKKTYEKCSVSWKILKNDIIDEFKWNSIQLDHTSLECVARECLLLLPNATTKEGISTIIVRPLQLFSNYSIETFVPQFLYSMKLFLSKYEKLTLDGLYAIIDLKGVSYSTVNFGMIKMIHMLLIRPKLVNVINAPYVFNIVLGIIRPFIAKKVLSRFKLSTYEMIKEDIDEENLHENLTGKYTLNMKEYFVKEYCDGNEELYEQLYEKCSEDVKEILKKNEEIFRIKSEGKKSTEEVKISVENMMSSDEEEGGKEDKFEELPSKEKEEKIVEEPPSKSEQQEPEDVKQKE